MINKCGNVSYYDSGRNQASVKMSEGITMFRSYDTFIVKNEFGKISLDENYWNYSATTGKYRNVFLAESVKETRLKIKSGEYKLENLN